MFQSQDRRGAEICDIVEVEKRRQDSAPVVWVLFVVDMRSAKVRSFGRASRSLEFLAKRANMFGLERKVVVITGAGHGLGKEFAAAFAREGARVAVADIDETAASKVAEGIVAGGGESIAVPVDVTSEESTLNMASHVTRAWGTINVLVNCAARVLRSVQKPHQPFDQLPLDEWERTFAVNVRGTLGCVRGLSFRQ